MEPDNKQYLFYYGDVYFVRLLSTFLIFTHYIRITFIQNYCKIRKKIMENKKVTAQFLKLI